MYAFAAPEEPATRARISVQAPANKRKHYKLVFIKAPQQQTIVDSEITLPAQEEEKTLIYVLSKNQKQAQPEIRIKQQQASQHAKPEVFFLKYKNEAEAQAIASGAISGQSAPVPADGEIISDGSVSILGQSSDSAYRSGVSSQSGASNVIYRGGVSGGNAAFGAPQYSGVSQYSVGSVGVLPAVNSGSSAGIVNTAAGTPSAYYGNSGSGSYGSQYSGSFGSQYSGASGAGLSGGFSAYSANQEPASVAIKVTTEPTTYASSTASTLNF